MIRLFRHSVYCLRSTYKHEYQILQRFCSTDTKITEQDLSSILKSKFPKATIIKVTDVSGGCGAMFNVFIEANEFKGLSIIKQHRQVYAVLDEQIRKIHGIHVETKISP